jgi:uncharacterized integral membrane protein
MRWVYLVLFIAIVTVIVVFIAQNRDDGTVKFFNQSITAPMAFFFIVVYFLGMWSGGTVVGFIKRAYQQAAQVK